MGSIHHSVNFLVYSFLYPPSTKTWIVSEVNALYIIICVKVCEFSSWQIPESHRITPDYPCLRSPIKDVLFFSPLACSHPGFSQLPYSLNTLHPYILREIVPCVHVVVACLFLCLVVMILLSLWGILSLEELLEIYLPSEEIWRSYRPNLLPNLLLLSKRHGFIAFCTKFINSLSLCEGWFILCHKGCPSASISSYLANL